MTAAELAPDTARAADSARCAADAEARVTASSPDALSLQSRLKRLQGLDGSALREEWRRLCRSHPPRVSRDLIMRALAYRLQETAFGGLSKWAQQSLMGSTAVAGPAAADGASKPKPMQALLKPGARIVREWHGRTHSVMVLDHAFEFEGRPYRSLTQIAREITGAHWSGPRFFGLAERSSVPAMWATPAHENDPDEAIGPKSLGQGGAPIEPRHRAAGVDRALARSRTPAEGGRP